jgi:DNA-binding XRE family transcriptional regulator
MILRFIEVVNQKKQILEVFFNIFFSCAENDHMIDTEKFRERLEECLDEHGMTRADLARYFHTGQWTVYAWFRQGYCPSLEYALQLSKLFNVTVEWLVMGEGEKVKSMSEKIASDTWKYRAINRIWDILPEDRRTELLDFGNFLCTRA